MPTSPRSPRATRPQVALLAAAATAALGLAPPAFAGDWYVDAAANCAAGNGSAAKPFCTIDAAVAAASDGDTVHVAAGSYGGFGDVDRSLTFIGTAGSGATIVDGVPGATAARVVASVAVEWRGFTVRNFDQAIETTTAADLTLDQCVFELGSGAGDALRLASGSTLAATACTISGHARGIEADASTITLADCTISDCHQPGGEGGGLLATGSTVTLERTQLLRCSSANFGGALHMEGGIATLIDCLIQDCETGGTTATPTGLGGGLSFDGVAATLIGTTIASNTLRFAASGDSYGHGGGIAAINGSALSLERCTLSSNTAPGGGGGLYAWAGASVVANSTRFDGNAAHSGGGLFVDVATLADCAIEGNESFPDSINVYHANSGGSGGGCFAYHVLTATDCRFVGNRAWAPWPALERPSGGAIACGQLVATRCEIAANVADCEGRGGGIFLGKFHLDPRQPSTLTDCAIVDNVATTTTAGVGYGGRGGGVYALYLDVAFTRCTIAGNSAESGATPTVGAVGGGLYARSLSGSVVTLDHTIVAGNVAALGGPDIDGSGGGVTTLDWNCIGDTNGANLSGSGPHDLLDIDPQFLDAANGDFTLAATSPCIDTGNPALLPSGKDVAAFPRLLDGDLDKKLELDRGAHEFSHVRLAITGQATPGGTITLDSRGTSGMATLLIAGFGESELRLKKLGALFVDLTQLHVVLPWVPLESSVDVDLDPTAPAPLTLYVQELAVAGGAGNFSNVVRLDIE